LELTYDANGLIPVVVQDDVTGQVLMVAWMNAEAINKTIKTQQAHFWSRSRSELWHKGATSGNYLDVTEILVDCDADTILLKVHPQGPACHTGEISCFFRTIGQNHAEKN